MYQCFYCPFYFCSPLFGSSSFSKLGNHLEPDDYRQCFIDCCWPLLYLPCVVSACIAPPSLRCLFDNFTNFFEPDLCQHTCYPCSRALKIEDETYKRSCSSCVGCTTCLISFCFMPVYCQGLRDGVVDKKLYFDPFFPCIPIGCFDCLQNVCTMPCIGLTLLFSAYVGLWFPFTCPISSLIDTYQITLLKYSGTFDYDDFLEDDSYVQFCVCCGFLCPDSD